MSDRNDAMNEQYQEQIEKREDPKLEPTGDPEHDLLNEQSHNLDALDPLRNEVVAADAREAVEGDV